MAFLELKDVCVQFGGEKTGLIGLSRTPIVKAVNHVSLSIQKGEILGLVGESGCGKSTLSRTIMQLQKPTSGSIWLEGVDLSALSSKEMRKRRLDFQMVFQDPYASLNPRFTVYQTLAEAISTRKKPKSKEEMRQWVIDLMDQVGLNPMMMNKYPHEFSGGQRQRVAIARALAPEPKLIIADEPVSALDVSIQSQILNLLSDLVKNFNLTMIFISHDLGVVHYIADRIAIMQSGSIVEYGDAEEVFTSPQNDYTRSLLDSVVEL